MHRRGGLMCPVLFLFICLKLVPMEEYERWLQRGLSVAESRCEGSYHCATPDCPGWCLYEDTVSVFHCPVCRKHNCLTCKVWSIKCNNTHAAKHFISFSWRIWEIVKAYWKWQGLWFKLMKNGYVRWVTFTVYVFFFSYQIAQMFLCLDTIDA